MTARRELAWDAVEAELEEQGAAILPGLLTPAACRAIAPPALQAMGEALRERLAPIAARWNEALGITGRGSAGPACALEFTRLREGEHRPLRQDAGDAVFRLRACLLLGAPGADFAGGELALVERRPRLQSRPMVLPLCQGDLAVFAANRRPVEGAAGRRYAVDLKHGVSRVLRGERVAIEFVFAGE